MVRIIATKDLSLRGEFGGVSADEQEADGISWYREESEEESRNILFHKRPQPIKVGAIADEVSIFG